MVATGVVPEISVSFQVTVEVITLVLPSAKVPVAVNGTVKPIATEGEDGVTAMDLSGFVTVKVAVPDMPPCVAITVTDAPGVTAVARPPAVMVAPVEALQVTVLVRSWVVLSAKVPVAVNC
jgi:hypothetical protein